MATFSEYCFTRVWFVLAVAVLLRAPSVSAQFDQTADPSNNNTIAPTDDVSPPLLSTLPALLPTGAPTSDFTEALDTLSPTLSPIMATTTDSPSARLMTTLPTEGLTTSPPSFRPTDAPIVTTGSPTRLTLAPTEMPVASEPSDATLSPTLVEVVSSVAPSAALVVTAAPSLMPSSEPTAVGSDMPSMGPTPDLSVPATLSPTEQGTSETGVPSDSPSFATATASPTIMANGTSAPVGVENSGTVENLLMTLLGMNQVMTPDAIADWEKTTEEHTKDWYERNSNLAITELSTTITLLEQQIVQVSRLRRRGLQETTSVEIKFDQALTYRTLDEDTYTLEAVALAPFEARADLNSYTESLISVNSEFADITSVQEVREGGGSGTTPPIVEPEEESGGLGTGAIVGIVVGCVGFVALIGGVGYYVSQRGDDGGYVTTSGKTPPSQLDVGMGNDEVSTLAEPNTIRAGSNLQGGVTGALSGESVQGGYGDQSVATVDYDYSKAYGGGGDNSVSSAGGTFGSQTHTNAAGGAVTIGGSTGGAGSNPLGGSFPESGSQFRGQNANVREELVDIYAPPGKLGVVIDTPDDGAPVVHAVKDSSVIADKLQVGDKLVAVDDEDVRSMTAIKVSKLISRKSANASRKLSIIRTVVVDE